MSLYNALFGTNDLASGLLRVLGLNPVLDIPRFRDCFIHGEEIVIHTRTGGGNRLWYENRETCEREYPEEFLPGSQPPAGPWNDDLRAHPCYLRDEDEPIDTTYCNFYFSFPKDFEEKLRLLAKDHQTPMPSERWQKVFEAMGG